MTFEIALALIMASSSGVSVAPEELNCLAQNVYHEARGESYKGQIAVAYVTLNRVGKKSFGDTICEVVHHSGQFAWTEDGLSDKAADRIAFTKAMRVAINVIKGVEPDPTQGATYFYNPNKGEPYWARAFESSGTIGSHRFMRTEG